MREYRVIIAPPAKDELESIRKYIIETFGDVLAADKLKLEIAKEISSLATFPERYQIYNVKLKLPKNIHVSFVKKYAIMYLIDENNNLVLFEKICYTSKDWKA